MAKIKNCLFLFGSLIICFATQAQKLKFKSLADMPEARMAARMVSDGNNVIVVGGFSPGKKTGIIKYNPDSKKWSVLTDSILSRHWCSVASLNNMIYIFNGLGSKNGSLGEEVDMSNSHVQKIKGSPVPQRSAGCATDGKYIYVFGGSSRDTTGITEKKTYSNQLLRYDPQTKTWISLASMPEAKECPGQIINGKLYVIGGYNGRTSNKLDIYDISSNSWAPPVTLPDSISSHATCVYKNKIFMVGDYYDKTRVASYDVITGEYKIYKNNMAARRHAAALVVGNKLYVAGGNTNPSGTSSLENFQVAELDE